jgi:hypothetical protein
MAGFYENDGDAGNTYGAAASASAAEAKGWAREPEDVLVPEGNLVDEYSALHYSKKAEASSGGIQVIADAAQLSADNSAASATVSSDAADASLSSASSAAADLLLTNSDVLSTNAYVAQSTLDAAATAADLVLTNADVVLTNADVVVTNADVVLTNADVVLTNADAASTAANLLLTDADTIATAADASSALVSANNAAASAGGALTGPASSPSGDFNLITNTALSDAASTLTAAQLFGGEFTITPTVARIQTLDTAANIISALSGSVDGSHYPFTVVNLAAFDVTIAAAAGVTLVGNMVVNGGPANFRVRRLSASTVSVTRLGVGAALITNEYASAPQTITSGSLLTLTHGLGVEPRFFDLYLVCVSADAGWSVGEKVNANMNSSTSGTTIFNTYSFTSSQIFFRYSSNSIVFIGANKTSGSHSVLINSSWNLVVRAYA